MAVFDVNDLVTISINAVSVLCNIALVLVGVWGIKTAVRTLKAVEKQADEMVNQAALMKEQTAIAQQAAEAALLNAQAVINSERPWLLIKLQHTVHGIGDMQKSVTISAQATNVGRSPAEVVYTELSCRNLFAGEKLDERDPFISESIPLTQQWMHTNWIAPGESFYPDRYSVSSVDVPEIWKYLEEGTRLLFVTGFVRYKDALSSDIHESRYCHSISVKHGTMTMTGPVGYNKLT